MNHLVNLLVVLLISTTAYGQEYKSDFEKYCQEGDTVKQIEVLKKWESEEPNNPELYTSYFNYYFQKSRQDIVSMMMEAPQGNSLAIQDSTGKTAGYIGSDLYFDPETFKKGLDKIDKGIELYPNRLDMRFGKIYALGQARDWSSFTDEILRTIQYSNENDNQWTWTNNEKKENGKDFLLSSIQTYQLNLYNTGSDDLLINMRTIAQEILMYYPNHIESLSNLSITYLLTGEYDKGIAPLLKAEKIDPEDIIVLANIAHGYSLKGDSATAIEYYRKVIQYGDESTKAHAKQQIEELEK
ncbi:tetratricopeptide repeat protein [Cryomorphaceae bacterium 1068]|nr:tetratricopeptide repeat protein [Cryomorphaceae bacterium 1068]